MLWYVIIPLGFTLLFDTLVVVLFRSGMSWGLRSQDTSFIKRVAKGWVRGWLLVIALMVPWLMILRIFLLAFDYAGSPEYAYYMFYGGIIVVLLYPGINIAQSTRSAHPSLAWKPAIVSALGWTVPFATVWSLGFWAWIWRGYRINRWIRSLGVDTSTNFYLFLAALVVIASMFLSRAIGMRVMSRQLDDLPEPPAPPPIQFFRKFLDALASYLSKVITALIQIVRPLISVGSLSRARIGWGVAWVFFTWLAAQRFGAYGLSRADFWLYTLRFALIIALLVSVSAGFIAALLMRSRQSEWKHTFVTAKTWAFYGLLSWAMGMPLGWGANFLYQQLLISLVKKSLITHATLNKMFPSPQTNILITGLIALLIGYLITRRKSDQSELNYS